MESSPKVNNVSSSTGIGFVGLLTIAFIVLKLTHVIAWSWWWVVSPLWISVLFFIAVILTIALVAVIANLFKPKRR